MCLSTVDKTDGIKDGIGYKVFTLVGGKRESYLKGTGTYRLGRWLKSEEFSATSTISSGSFGFGSTYTAGFHILTNRRDAEALLRCAGTSHVLCRVAYRKATSKGTQLVVGRTMNKPAQCVVASEMKLLEELKST